MGNKGATDSSKDIPVVEKDKSSADELCTPPPSAAPQYEVLRKYLFINHFVGSLNLVLDCGRNFTYLSKHNNLLEAASISMRISHI